VNKNMDFILNNDIILISLMVGYLLLFFLYGCLEKRIIKLESKKGFGE
jgi:hypothetical protein